MEHLVQTRGHEQAHDDERCRNGALEPAARIRGPAEPINDKESRAGFQQHCEHQQRHDERACDQVGAAPETMSHAPTDDDRQERQLTEHLRSRRAEWGRS